MCFLPGLCRPGTDHRDYVYYLGVAYFRLAVSACTGKSWLDADVRVKIPTARGNNYPRNFEWKVLHMAW